MTPISECFGGAVICRAVPPTGGRPPVGETRTAVADAAGLSEHQRKTAARVANIPADEFEAAVESDNPPTIEDLAERGTKKKTVIETQDTTKMCCRHIGSCGAPKNFFG